MQRVEILITDLIGRFQKGEIGVLEENDYSEKYDFRVRLTPIWGIDPFTQKKIMISRVLYFYKNEVELL